MYNIELRFGDAEVNKKEYDASKKPIALNIVDIVTIVICEKFKHSDNGSNYFIDFKDDIIRLLCIVLPQMSRYMKYFDNGEKIMFFEIEDDNVLVK